MNIAKRSGANAISVAHEVSKKLNPLKGRFLPNDVEITITRNYGETAAEKSNALLLHMGIAVLGVSLLILLTLGWRESCIVAIAIPSMLALTLLVFYLYGYTLNRITLFALIFSIGILVDDAIVVVENIVRHFHLPQNKGRNGSVIAVEAVNEVGNPTVLETFGLRNLRRRLGPVQLQWTGAPLLHAPWREHRRPADQSSPKRRAQGPEPRHCQAGSPPCHGDRVALRSAPAVAEVPPGPPVLQTLVAEVYGPTEESRLALANKVIGVFKSTPGGVDTDWYMEANQPKVRLVIDKEKAALSGVSTETISETLQIAVVGVPVDLLHVLRDKEPVNIVFQLPRSSRTTPDALRALRVRSGANPSAPLVPLRELVNVEQTTVDKSIYRKNLIPVI